MHSVKQEWTGMIGLTFCIPMDSPIHIDRIQGISKGATRAKWDLGRSGSLLKKQFFRETHFHSITRQSTYYHCTIFLLPFNGNSMCYG